MYISLLNIIQRIQKHFIFEINIVKIFLEKYYKNLQKFKYRTNSLIVKFLKKVEKW